MLGPIQLSVAVVTRNRAESLHRCLQSLRAQNAQPFEIVVSDDSEGGQATETRTVTERWGGRYVVGPRRGLYANRNHAALACRGSHVRTMDDDHTFPAGHLEQCLGALEHEPHSIWTTGETSYLSGQHYATAPTANQLHPSGSGSPPEDPDNNWAIADGSTIYPREIFEAGFRMIEDYPFGSSYLEFGAILYHRGYRSRCLQGLLVEHHMNQATLERGHDDTVIESYCLASLSYNLFFRPNLLRAGRCWLALLWGARAAAPRLALALPRLYARARLRWRGGIRAGCQ
jgi:glycosyltransferase involved in cell wall biosynthesis